MRLEIIRTIHISSEVRLAASQTSSCSLLFHPVIVGIRIEIGAKIGRGKAGNLDPLDTNWNTNRKPIAHATYF